MGQTRRALVAATTQTVRRPEATLAIAGIGVCVALVGVLAWMAIVHGTSGGTQTATLVGSVAVAAGLFLALGNATVLAAVWIGRTYTGEDSLRGRWRAVTVSLPQATAASLALVVLAMPALVAAVLIAAVVDPWLLLRSSHGTDVGAPALGVVLTFEAATVATVVTVFLGDWVSPYGVHAVVTSLTLLLVTPIRFVDAAALVHGEGPLNGLRRSRRAALANPVGVLGYAAVRSLILVAVVALATLGWQVAPGLLGHAPSPVGLALSTIPATVLAFPLLYRFHLEWYVRATDG